MEEMRRSQLELGRPVDSFSISTETARSRLTSFPRFLIERTGGGRLGNIVAGNFDLVAGEGAKFLMFDATWYQRNYSARVRIRLDSPMVVEIFADRRDPEFSRRIEDYLLFNLQFFEESLRSQTMYMSFVPGSEETSRLTLKRKFSDRFLTGNMLNLFLLFFVMAFVIWLLLSPVLGHIYTAIVMIAILLGIVLSAGKIVAFRSDWRITESNPEVALIEYHLDQMLMQTFLSTYQSALPALKRALYDRMTSDRSRLTSSEVAKVFTEFGMNTRPDQVVVRRINVYDMVQRAAARFNMSIPTITVTRNIMPNAAATGFTKHFATMLITLGLLIQLDERETGLVVGHELSHLRSGDPVILFSLVGAEYFLRVLYLAPVLSYFPPGFVFLYLIMIFWLIFFFGKLLETRADLEAALILKDPKTMANSLKKIGFRKLALGGGFIEGQESSLGDWFAFDPHPPIGFRIRRLEHMELGELPRHTFLRSVRDVFRGISRAMRS